jgi:hypothetical protein
MMKDKIEEKNNLQKKKKVAIKRMKTKLYTKNKWKETFVFYQWEERKKKKGREIHQNHTVNP